MIYYPFDKKECEEFVDERSKVLVEEKGKKYIAKNNNHYTVCLIHVDNCLIIKGDRCDYLLLKYAGADKTAYFIELKGKDLSHASEQIDKSMDSLLPKLSAFKVHARIVLSKVPPHDLRSNNYKKLQNRLKKLNGTLLQKVRLMEEEI